MPINVVCNSSKGIGAAVGVNPETVATELCKNDREQQNNSRQAHFEIEGALSKNCG
jgi:hypothetical protein